MAEQPYKRLQRARELAGYASATDAANAMGVALPTYLAHENGSRGFRRSAERYAAFFRADLTWLLTGKGSPKGDTWTMRIMQLSTADQRTIQQMVEFLEAQEALRRKTG